MKKYKKCESVFFFIHYFSRQEGEDDFRELVHHGDHCLPVAESLRSFLVIIGTEEWGIDDSSLSHYVGIFSETPVAVFGYMPFAIAFSRLIDGRIGAHVCYEFLVGCESGDVLDLGHEMGCRDFAYARDGLEDFHLLFMYCLLMLYESLCEGFVPLLKVQYLLSAVIHEVGVPRYPYAPDCIALYVLGGCLEGSSSAAGKSGDKLLIGSGKNLVRRGELRKEAEHGGCKHIDSKDFRLGEGKVALELCLCPGDVLGNFLSSSCDVPPPHHPWRASPYGVYRNWQGRILQY